MKSVGSSTIVESRVFILALPNALTSLFSPRDSGASGASGASELIFNF